MQKITPNPAIPITNLENLVKLTPILTSVILAVSLTFDSAYLWAMGLTLFDIPSSIAEHIRSALLWLPIFLGILIFGGIEHAFSINKDKITSSKKPDKYTMYKLYGSVAFTIIVLLIASINDKTFQYAFIMFSLIWTVVIIKFISAHENNQQQPSLFIRILYGLPVVLAIFGYIGYFIGNKTFNHENPQWEYTIKNETKEVEIKVHGQRRFTDFTIAIIPDKKIIIIPNINIITMKSL